MRAWHHVSAGVAAVLLLISLGGTWFSVELPQGTSFSITGLALSAIASTLLGALAAAYGASLLVRGWLRRTVGALQSLLGMGAVWAWVVALPTPYTNALMDIQAATGISGPAATEGIVVVSSPVMIILGFIGVVSAIVSGVTGVIALDSPSRSSRYERAGRADDAGDPIAVWDSLSEGSDPTKR